MSKKFLHKTTKNFKNEVYSVFGNEYTVLDEYSGWDIPISVKHSCGNIFNTKPNQLLSNKGGCVKCKFKKISLLKKCSHADFIKKFEKLPHYNEYTVLTEYVSSSEKISIKHSCGNIYMVSPVKLLSGRQCPICQKAKSNASRTMTLDTFRDKLITKYNGEYDITDSSIYLNNKTHINLLHKKCGKVFSSRPNDILSGYECNICNPPRMPRHSRSHNIIKNWLNDKKFEFEEEVRFDSLKYKSKLAFDFGVVCNNSSETYFILIEYNGEQHYYARGRHTEEDLSIQQARDLVKVNWCKNNNILLYIIKYDENIIFKLNEIFSTHQAVVKLL